MINARHRFRTDADGEPLKRDFTPKQWSRLLPITQDGKKVAKDGWVKTRNTKGKGSKGEDK